MPDISELSTLDLVKALAARDDIQAACIDPKTGRVGPEAFKVRRELGPIACTDMVPVFQADDGTVLGGCIPRGGNKANPFYGLHAYDGGVIGMHMTIEEAMRYHARVDLGLEIELPLGSAYPVRVNEYDPPMADGTIRAGFHPEWDKHSIGLLHLTYIDGDPNNPKFGNKSGQQEALGFNFFSLENAPPLKQWAYGQGAGWREVVKLATQLRDTGALTLPRLPKVA